MTIKTFLLFAILFIYLQHGAVNAAFSEADIHAVIVRHFNNLGLEFVATTAHQKPRTMYFVTYIYELRFKSNYRDTWQASHTNVNNLIFPTYHGTIDTNIPSIAKNGYTNGDIDGGNFPGIPTHLKDGVCSASTMELAQYYAKHFYVEGTDQGRKVHHEFQAILKNVLAKPLKGSWPDQIYSNSVNYASKPADIVADTIIVFYYKTQ
ncbi:hypothetical protein Ddc_21810 [Ditylenchus destructor]|nr:hypothetical protein Ddc_21810 [Ditylenchus destructor]